MNLRYSRLTVFTWSTYFAFAALACSSDEPKKETPAGAEGSVCSPETAHCDDDLTCAPVSDGEHRCFGRLVLRGDVFDTADNAPLESAHVIALDVEGTAVTNVAVTDGDGNYLLDVPVMRNEDGSPVATSFTLQGSAHDHQPFPSGVRVALPIHTAEAQLEGRLYVIDNALTRIGLIPLEPADRFSIAGSVVGLSESSAIGGALVVATGDTGSFSAITDHSGSFRIFNVLDGNYALQAYAAGLQVESADVSVEGGEVTGIELKELDQGTTTVTGNVQIVDAPGGSVTSVILAVADTFDVDAARGEVPRGLRAPKSGPVSITGEFTIEGVPAGRYVVLAAYENDGLVRDIDSGIAGTDLVYIDVTADQETLAVSQSFKVTAALETFAPGVDAAEAVTSKPMLTWQDDASESFYEVRVFDAFGEEVWNALNLPAVSGSSTVSVQYEGPLEPGMYYQFRATSWRQVASQPASIVSSTEDLRGVFYLPAE